MYNRFSQWDLSIFLPSQHWTMELHQGNERAITRPLRVSSVCVSDTPPPSRTQVDGRPKCTCEPGEHGSELTARCSKWDQPHEANPALRWEVNQDLTTLLMVVDTEEAQLCSSPCPSDVPISHRSIGKWHSCITTELPLGCSACSASPEAFILVHPHAQGSESSPDKLTLPSEEAHLLQRQPQRIPFQLWHLSKMMVSQKWNKRSIGAQGGFLTEQMLLFSRGYFTSQSHTSAVTTFSWQVYFISPPRTV